MAGEELREQRLHADSGGAEGGGDVGAEEGKAADDDEAKDELRPVVCVAVCTRLCRVLAVYGRDVMSFDALTGAHLGGCSDICPHALSTLAIDGTERTAFVGSLGGEVVQLVLSETAVQVEQPHPPASLTPTFTPDFTSTLAPNPHPRPSPQPSPRNLHSATLAATLAPSPRPSPHELHAQVLRRLGKQHGPEELVSMRVMTAWGSGGTKTSDGKRKDPELERHGSLLLSLSTDGLLCVTSVQEGRVTTSAKHKAIGESTCVAACSHSSLVAVGGVTDGEGVLAVHRMWDATSIRVHCPSATIKMAEVTALAFLATPPPAASSSAARPLTSAPPSPVRAEMDARDGATPPSAAPASSALHSLASRRRLLLVADATSTLVLFDVSASGRPPHPLQRFSHPRPRASWLTSSRSANLSRQLKAQARESSVPDDRCPPTSRPQISAPNLRPQSPPRPHLPPHI